MGKFNELRTKYKKTMVIEKITFVLILIVFLIFNSKSNMKVLGYVFLFDLLFITYFMLKYDLYFWITTIHSIEIAKASTHKLLIFSHLFIEFIVAVGLILWG